MDDRDRVRFANWIKSLQLPEADALDQSNLCKMMSNGILLLKIIDISRRGSVDWSKVNWNTHNKFKMLANCNLAVSIMHDLCQMQGLANGRDIVEESPKPILSLLWVLMREYFARAHGVKSEEKFKEIANQYLPDDGKDGFVAAVTHDILDTEPLMIVLYYGDEGEAFMTFHDESRLECALMPKDFTELSSTAKSDPEKPVNFTMRSSVHFKSIKSSSKSKPAMEDKSDLPSPSTSLNSPISHALSSNSIRIEPSSTAHSQMSHDISAVFKPALQCTNLSNSTPLNFQTSLLQSQPTIISKSKNRSSLQFTTVRNHPNIPQCHILKLSNHLLTPQDPIFPKDPKDSNLLKEPMPPKDPNTSNNPTISSFKGHANLPKGPNSSAKNTDAVNQHTHEHHTDLTSHRRRVINVLSDKANSYHKSSIKVDAVDKQAYCSVDHHTAKRKRVYKPDKENVCSPVSTDYYLSWKPGSQVKVPKFGKVSKDACDYYRKQESGDWRTGKPDERLFCSNNEHIEHVRVDPGMTTFLFILQSEKLRQHFAKPLQEYFKKENFSQFRVGTTSKLYTPICLKQLWQASLIAHLKLSKINKFFEAELKLPSEINSKLFSQVPHDSRSVLGEQTISQQQDDVSQAASDICLQTTALRIDHLLSNLKDSQLKKSLRSIVCKLEAVVKLPVDMLSEMFDRALKTKLSLKEKLTVKRIRELMRQVGPQADHREELALKTVNHADSSYLPVAQATWASLSERKAAYRSALKKRLENLAAGMPLSTEPVWQVVSTGFTRVN